MHMDGVFGVGLQSADTCRDAYLVILHGLKSNVTPRFISLGRGEHRDEGSGHLLVVIWIGRRRIAGI